MGEIKKQQQYVDVAPVDLAKGVVDVLNRLRLHDALRDRDRPRFQVRADDRVLAEGALPALDVPPHATKPLTVPLPAITPEPGVEYWLDLIFALKADTPWAKAGLVLAHEQLPLAPAKPAPPLATAALPELTVTGGAQAGRRSGAPTSRTASTRRRACSPRSSRRAWSCWPARCGPTSGARPTTTTAAAT